MERLKVKDNRSSEPYHLLSPIWRCGCTEIVSLSFSNLRHDDEQERQREEQARESVSANMDDTGFFSVQVIAKAISVWGLELVNFNSSDAVAVNARQDPV